MTTVIDRIPGDSPDEDPDAQHTVNDFLDYTEYLPSDLVRSLTLIGKLDESYLTAADSVHDLSKEYGSLPSSKSSKRSARNLRYDISQKLDHAIRCRESAYGEASRLYEMVDRHFNRLTSIITKLQALPKPPSRDPTPIPRSPQAIRKTPPTRLTLRLDGPRAAAASVGTHAEKPPKRFRSRKVTVPGEVLPPPNPDSPAPFTDSDWESAPPSPLPMPTSRVGGSSRKTGRIRPPKVSKLPKLKIPKPPRPPRLPGAMGTNVHSTVAGISTSNALSLLTPPPEDARAGSKYAPWMRLTEWEMAKLRKRMKKNAIWTPSETMIRRELSLANRGPDNYRKARKLAEEAGEDLLDDDNIAGKAPGAPLLPGEISADSLGLLETTLENRGMKLNEAKKMKREVLARERASELEDEARKLGTLGTTFKELFSNPPAQPISSHSLIINPPKIVEAPKVQSILKEKPKEAPKEIAAKPPAKKRKRDDTPKVEPVLADSLDERGESPKQPEPAISPVKASTKKRRTDEDAPAPLKISTKTVTTSVPLAAPAPSPTRPARRSTPVEPSTPVMAAPAKPKVIESPRPTATSTRPRRISLTLKGPAEPPPEPAQTSPRVEPRTSSRRSSLGPTSAPLNRDHPRRKSATPAPPTSPVPIVTAAGRRSKRPAPGPVVENAEEGPAISVGKRQHAPRKKGGAFSSSLLNTKRAVEDSSAKVKEEEAKAQEDAAGEYVDPDEPRYCYCGDVSYGGMVACENDNCEREWFHFGCVGLTEPPPRRAKWYCDDCKKILGKK